MWLRLRHPAVYADYLSAHNDYDLPKADDVPDDTGIYEVPRVNLPLSYPLPLMSLWNTHPKVYLSIHKSRRERCPYCSIISELMRLEFVPYRKPQESATY